MKFEEIYPPLDSEQYFKEHFEFMNKTFKEATSEIFDEKYKNLPRDIYRV